MNIVWTVVNLLILFILLRIFLFKPVLGMIEKRKGVIQSSLSDAEKANTDAKALKTQYENSLKEAKKEGFEIVSEAKDRAQTQYDQIIEKANADASQIVKQATAAAVADRERLLKETQAEIVGVALAAAEKLLGSKVDDEANRDMLNKFLAEAGDRQ
jgi:F-type H+-transporting ATPase subunit b